METEATQVLTERETAQEIADALGETEQVFQICKIVKALGNEQAHALLSQALEIEHNGGMMVRNGSRRRTVGGVFFHLAYTVGCLPNGKRFKRYGMTKELAEIYRTQGKYEEAEPFYQRLLALDERRLVLSLNNLAELYRVQGKYKQAKPLLARVLAICKARWGNEHPYTRRVHKNYAFFLRVMKEDTKRKIWKRVSAWFDFLVGR